MPRKARWPSPGSGVQEYPGWRRGEVLADGWCVRSSHCYKMRPLPPTVRGNRKIVRDFLRPDRRERVVGQSAFGEGRVRERPRPR